MISISALHVYPVKSCAGIDVSRARLTATGFPHDREWMVVRGDGRFVTQREQPRLALITPSLSDVALTLRAPGMDALVVAFTADETPVQTKCWNDVCAAFDTGSESAAWLSRHLGAPHRLVHFDTSRARVSDPAWTGEIVALNQFSDGYPWLVISEASLADLNTRLPKPLPMNRFRPNIVITGVAPYAEDRILEMSNGAVTLRIVKGCTRCIITTTNQDTATRDGEEPLRTLRRYRLDEKLRGVIFGQNVIAVAGIGNELAIGDTLQARWRSSAS